MIDSNFAALDLQRLTVPLMKDFNPVVNIISAEETGSILKIGFALLKLPHLHRTYLVDICNQNFRAVFQVCKLLRIVIVHVGIT